MPSTSRPARDRRHVADDLTALLAQIRDLDGFQSFGLPPATGELLAQAKAGPVVTFNISSYRSDALILTETGITSLELPGLAEDTLMDQVDTFYEALSATGRPGPAADRTGAQGTLQEILGWLWEVAAGPVLQVLGYHQPPPDGTAWPRVWWVPGGLLGLLPLHAAGYHAIPPDPQHRAVLDRVVSSYTPTVGALKQAREHARASASVPGRSLIVAMPTTPGLPNLPNVAREAAMLQARLPSPVLLTEPDPAGQAPAEPDELPTRDNVLAHLPGAAIAHFACHGFSNPADPSQSLLRLHDHRDSPLNVAALAAVSPDHAQLAYLSACTTARPGGAGLLDEAIHLSSALQLAGFPQVIGTLWEIYDEFAVTMCDTFYTDLTTSAGAVDTSHSARSLHQAIRKMRHRQPAFPALWAAYIHAGA